ncbi:MAG: antibiotic biosynthesis monooxygenase [Burkholderiales bacterium]|nr:antibiotic biosynthesis monooxygenase [Burkholderiales bacterium]
MSVNPDDIVTFIIQHKVRPAHRRQYEDWLRDVGREAERYPGHLGTNVVRPPDDNGQYTIIIRFDCYDHLRAWVESDTRREYVRRVEPILDGGDRIEIKSGLDFWFTPPGVRAPNRFKQFLITFSAIYPLTLLVPAGLAPLFEAVPLLDNLFISRLLVAGVIVWLMVYVVMPRYTRAVAAWLYR